MKYLLKIIVLTAVCACSNAVLWAQPYSTIEVPKPPKYETRELKSEKTGEGKLGVIKRFGQNAKTRFNFYFNAKTKINDVVDNAKLQYTEDYTKLLSFYNYSLDATSQQKAELDSVIYKATAGILLHDLRSDWVDNMYMLIGKAYLLQKNYDSAQYVFQYINYAFAPKDDGYDIPIGSNSYNESGTFSVATKEKKGLLNKMIAMPPSRNESFIWQARNYIESGYPNEAMGLIQILRNDPHYPKRLNSELDEMSAYAFYKLNAYDSAAYYLSKSLDEADTRQERARWEYLIAQLYTRAGKTDDAVKYYEKSMKHTINPVMEVYARLASISLNNSGKKEDYLKSNLEDLVKMAKKDKYELYRDIIYYAAAQVALEMKDYKTAQKYLLKSIANSIANPSQRSLAFVQLGDINYTQKTYDYSYNYYDSTDIKMIDSLSQGRVNFRKPPLKIISENLTAIHLQDSLLHIASLPEAQRDAEVRKIVRKLRKEKGLKEEVSSGGSAGALSSLNQNNSSQPVFSQSSGEWYFANASMKAKGYSEFKSLFGNRPNADNWRRQSAVALAGNNNANNTVSLDTANKGAFTNNPYTEDGDITFESVMNTLPTVPEKVVEANRLVVEALYKNAQVFQNNLEDYESAIAAYEEILKRQADTKYKEELLFNLAYLYGKINNTAKADEAKQNLKSQFEKGEYIQKLNPPKKSEKDIAITKQYEGIYNKFLAGKYDEALAEKKIADSIHGKTYWNPQLSFIESIYYIQQRQDSLAIIQLNNIVSTSDNKDFAEKAKTMINVLKRRTEIENYLTNLQVTRNEDEPSAVVNTNVPEKKTEIQKLEPNKEEPKKEELKKQEPEKTKPVVVAQDSIKAEIKEPLVNITDNTETKDSTATKPATPAIKGFAYNAADAHYVMMVFNDVAPTFVSEARNAFSRYNAENIKTKWLQGGTIDKITDANNILLLGMFGNADGALNYYNKIKPEAATRIVPWLTADKYSFLIISAANLNVLKENKDLPTYKEVLTKALPGVF